MSENTQIDALLCSLEEKLQKTVSVLREEYTAVRAGRANPHCLDKVMVDYYGTLSPLQQVANIAAADAKCLVISPWDASLLKGIEKAILAANLGLTPTNDGKVIRIVFPDLTEERRKELAKQIKAQGEDSKVAVRNIRRDSMDSVKKMKNNKELAEDVCANIEKEIEKMVAKAVDAIDKLAQAKEKEILSV